MGFLFGSLCQRMVSTASHSLAEAQQILLGQVHSHVDWLLVPFIFSFLASRFTTLKLLLKEIESEV